MVPLWMLYAVSVTPGTLRQVQSHVFTATNKSRLDDRARSVAKYKRINNQSRILFAPAKIKNRIKKPTEVQALSNLVRAREG